jgi:hypothetical protein
VTKFEIILVTKFEIILVTKFEIILVTKFEIILTQNQLSQFVVSASANIQQTLSVRKSA